MNTVAKEILHLNAFVNQGLHLAGKCLAAFQHTTTEEQKLVLRIELLRIFHRGKLFGAHLNESIAHHATEYPNIVKIIGIIESSPLSLERAHRKPSNSSMSLVSISAEPTLDKGDAVSEQ